MQFFASNSARFPFIYLIVFISVITAMFFERFRVFIFGYIQLLSRQQLLFRLINFPVQRSIHHGETSLSPLTIRKSRRATYIRQCTVEMCFHRWYQTPLTKHFSAANRLDLTNFESGLLILMYSSVRKVQERSSWTYSLLVLLKYIFVTYFNSSHNFLRARGFDWKSKEEPMTFTVSKIVKRIAYIQIRFPMRNIVGGRIEPYLVGNPPKQ